MKYIWILAFVFPMNLVLGDDDWAELFNGKNLDGWTERNKSGSFRVEDGTIIGTAKEGLGTTFLCTNEVYADFELEFETRLIDPELNSGVQVRSANRPPKGKQKVGPVEGPQVEFAAKKPERGSRSGNIYGQGWGGWLTPNDKIRSHTFVKGGEWNRFRVVAKGDQVTTWINGSKVITTTIPAERHKTHASGFIGLQIHGIKDGTGPFEVAWRNIRIRRLEEVEEKKKTVSNTSSNRIYLKHQGPKTPFRPLPEFADHELSRFAMAPEINCPVSVIAEPGGAVYALCDGNAGLGRLPDQGSVWRLVDEDDSGKADYATKYIPNIDTPRGGQFLNGVLYLVHPPFVSAFRDLDGDGVADDHQILASGFAHDLNWTRGGDHSTNDLRVGIDGWIYVAVGDFGANAIGSDGSKASVMSGGVIRMRLDGSDVEIYSQGTRNTYDLAINHRLDILAMDNTNDGDGWDMRLHHLTPLAHMGYPNLYKNFSDDAMPPLFCYGGGSGCGALYLEEPGFPDWLNGKMHTISWGKLYTHDLTSHEATFINKDKVALNMNKLVDLDVDGSSRLYFANFENGGARIEPGAIVGHLVQAKPKGWQYRAFPDLDSASPEQLVTFLDQGSAVLRQQSQWALIHRKDQAVPGLLHKTVVDTSLSLEARIAALYAINLRNNSGAIKTLMSLLDDNSLAEYALRALLDRDDRKELGLDKIIEDSLESSDPRVKLHAVVGTYKLGLKHLTGQLLELSKEKQRLPLENGVAHVHEAIPHTARRALIEMASLDELHAALSDTETRQSAFAVLRQIHSGENVGRLTDALKHAADTDSTLELIAVLVRLFHRERPWDGEGWWGTRPNSAGPYFYGVTWDESKTIAKALRQAVKELDEAAQKKVLYQVRHHNVPLEELNLPIEIDPLEQLLEQSEHTFEQQADLLSIVTDTGRTKGMRVAAFRAALSVTGFTYAEWCVANLKALHEIENEKDLYTSLSSDFVQNPSHRFSMIQRVPKAWSKMKRLKPAQHTLYFDVLCTLAQSPLTTEEDRSRIIRGVDKGILDAGFLDAIARNRASAYSPFLKSAAKDSKYAKQAGAILESFAQGEGTQLVGKLSIQDASAAVLKMSGDIEEGKVIFTRQSCGACHSILPDEPQKGPYLGSVGNLFDREQLITHVINPGAEVAQGFQTYSFQLKDGSAALGFVTARDDKKIELRNIAGIVQVIQTSDVKKEDVLKTSMMPPGLVNNLTVQDFASLIDYLQSLH